MTIDTTINLPVILSLLGGTVAFVKYAIQLTRFLASLEKTVELLRLELKLVKEHVGLGDN